MKKQERDREKELKRIVDRYQYEEIYSKSRFNRNELIHLNRLVAPKFTRDNLVMQNIQKLMKNNIRREVAK